MDEYMLRQKVADMARSYIGSKESDGTHKPIIDLYNQIVPLPRGYRMKYTDPWCAAFVSVVFSNCGLLSIAPAECACDPMIALYKQLGRWVEDDAYDAQVGDVIFYDWQDSGAGDNTGSSDHVGVITGKNGERFEIIEGNTSDMVGRRYVYRNGKNIRGFGCPDYAAVATDAVYQPVEPSQPEIPVEPTVKTYSIELPLMVYGDVGEIVRSAQLLLIGRGYKCGWWGADGEFGDGTLKATQKFQRDYGLELDGEIGGQTWTALIKGGI